jgi:hypothetical protein
MGCETYAKTFFGIKMTLIEIKKLYFKYVSEGKFKPESDFDDETYGLEELVYGEFLEKYSEKFGVDWEEINGYEDDFYAKKKKKNEKEVCIYIWMQEPDSLWGRGGSKKNVVESSYEDFQSDLESKKGNLKSFMTEFELDENLHKLNFFTTLTVSS